MWHQIQDMGEDLMKISAAHPEGINLIGIKFNTEFTMHINIRYVLGIFLAFKTGSRCIR
jgi:hypothetical protein